jgi:hypothetical protein
VVRRLPWLGSSRDPYASLSLSSTRLIYSALPLSSLARVEPRFRLLHHRCLRPVFFIFSSALPPSPLARVEPRSVCMFIFFAVSPG